MTNGDYIRTLITDEVMAKNPRLLCDLAHSFLRNDPDDPWSCAGCPFDEDNLCESHNSEKLAEWLKAERKEEEPVEDV